MKILFRNTTKYDKENRENFINFHKRKFGKKELIQAIIILTCVVYILMFNLINLNWIGVLILVALGVLFYFLNKYVVSKKKTKKNKQKNKEFTFFFYERHIKIKFKRQFERMNYFEIKKVFETDENFFLYTDDTHSLILDKDGFSVGTVEGFTEFIKKKCPFKYRNEENEQEEKKEGNSKVNNKNKSNKVEKKENK